MSKMNFQYVPISGPISGPEFESQTAAAINEIGDIASDAGDVAENALQVANTANATANKAIDRAEEAITIAKDATGGAEGAQETANLALETANRAETKADAASATADDAKTTAETALSTANNADSKATTANATANAAQSAVTQLTTVVNETKNIAEQAFEWSTNAVYFENTTEAIDVNTVVTVRALRIDNIASANLPVAKTGFLASRLDSDEEHSYQMYIDDAGKIFTRTGALTDNQTVNNGTDTIAYILAGSTTQNFNLSIVSAASVNLRISEFTGTSNTVSAATETSLSAELVFPIPEGFSGNLNIGSNVVVTVSPDGAIIVNQTPYATANGTIAALTGTITGQELTIGIEYAWTNITHNVTAVFSSWVEEATKTELDTKQDNLTFDNTPTIGSTNPVTSEGIFSALATKQNTLTFDGTPTEGSTNPVTSGGIFSAIREAHTNVYNYKGSVPTKSDLPTTGNEVGDVYNVEDDNANYAWDGTEWDSLGGIISVDATPTEGSANPVSSGGTFTALSGKQATLTFDDTPKLDSQNPVTSTGIYNALGTKQDMLTVDAVPIADSANPVASGGVFAALAGKQNTLTFDDTPTAGSTNPVTSDGIRAAIEAAGGGSGEYLPLTGGTVTGLTSFTGGLTLTTGAVNSTAVSFFSDLRAPQVKFGNEAGTTPAQIGILPDNKIYISGTMPPYSHSFSFDLENGVLSMDDKAIGMPTISTMSYTDGMTLDAYTIYQFDNVTSLNFGDLPSSFLETTVYFTSSGSFTVTSTDAEAGTVGSMDVEANAKYVLSICNKVLVLGKIDIPPQAPVYQEFNLTVEQWNGGPMETHYGYWDAGYGTLAPATWNGKIINKIDSYNLPQTFTIQLSSSVATSTILYKDEMGNELILPATSTAGEYVASTGQDTMFNSYLAKEGQTIKIYLALPVD